MTETRFWLIRHGPVDHAGRILGRLDLPCLPLDSEAVAAVAGTLPLDPVWIKTPLRRTAETLTRLQSAYSTAAVSCHIEPDLMEQDFGTWTGKTWEDCQRDFPEQHTIFWRDPANSRPPGGESFFDLSHRVQKSLTRLAQTYVGRNLIAVVHAGTIRAALTGLRLASIETVFAMHIPYLAMARLDYDGIRWRFWGMN